jgi:hypothetical protein
VASVDRALKFLSLQPFAALVFVLAQATAEQFPA